MPLTNALWCARVSRQLLSSAEIKKLKRMRRKERRIRRRLREAAATRLQAMARAKASRDRVRRMRNKVDFLAGAVAEAADDVTMSIVDTVSLAVARYLAHGQQTSAATLIQSVHRGRCGRRRANAAKLDREAREREARRRDQATVKIQVRVGGYARPRLALLALLSPSRVSVIFPA